MKKDKNKAVSVESDGTKRIIDLRRFLEHSAVTPDANGSYTDMPAGYYETGEPEMPVQDADDL